MKFRTFVCPPPLQWIIPWKEMYQVFNMGHRFELYVEPSKAAKIIRISQDFDIDARIIGKVETSDKNQLTIKSEFGEFNYSRE